MAKPVIVVHYHELWLKGGNRRFFLSKLHTALKKALEGIPVERILRPGDRLLIEFGEGAPLPEAIARTAQAPGVAHGCCEPGALFAEAKMILRSSGRRGMGGSSH